MDTERIKILRAYAADPAVEQLLEVECTGGSGARVRYYIKFDGLLRLVHRGSAWIGKNGPGKTGEGDARTPLGELRPLRAFGILPDPGTALEYIPVTPGTLACDCEGPFYNRIVKPADYGASAPGGERMWELSPEYDYGLQTDFNPRNEYPLGSAIFIHCKGARTWTGGCVALDKRIMRQILKTATGGLRIWIH